MSQQLLLFTTENAMKKLTFISKNQVEVTVKFFRLVSK